MPDSASTLTIRVPLELKQAAESVARDRDTTLLSLSGRSFATMLPRNVKSLCWVMMVYAPSLGSSCFIPWA